MSFLSRLLICHAFIAAQPTCHQQSQPSAKSIFYRCTSVLRASPFTIEERRRELLSRKGPYFQLNRSSGKIEFGATANLVTTLGSEPQEETINAWLADTVSLARSIWEPSLTTDLGDSVFRLQIMTLQFVTIQLTPSVDVQMKTVTSKQTGRPIFSIQSIAFDPNIQVLGFPGIEITADSLGIEIEVSGQMKLAKDGKGVIGAIAFQTIGELPPPMRLLPDQILKGASDTINQAIVDFAITSFQKGAKQNFDAFLKQRRAPAELQEPIDGVQQ